MMKNFKMSIFALVEAERMAEVTSVSDRLQNLSIIVLITFVRVC